MCAARKLSIIKKKRLLLQALFFYPMPKQVEK